jgi:P4 family phage/plasmid primase-like protien
MMREICSNNDDKLRCMLEFVGVSLLGHATAMQKVLVVLGTGGNGKSQYLDVVEGVFEPHERVCVPPQMMGNEYRRYQFVGASINLINEVSASRMRAEASAAFKAIVSGDHIEGRHIREMPVTFSPRAGHIMSANTLWMIEDESDGMFRRLMVVRLTEQFHESLNRVRDLGKSVLAVEHHDIFDLFVRHGIEALKRGEYTTPSDSVEEVAEWKRSQDPVAQWIHEEMEETPATHGAMSGELYATYTVWAEINGHDAISSTLFGRRLGALKIPKHKGRRGNHWGLRAVRMPH